MKITFRSIVGFLLIVLLFSTNLVQANEQSLLEPHTSVLLQSSDKKFKYGQYVFVTLKDGSRTVGKIAGKKNSKKYYVNQLDGKLRGVVHVKYIQKMTKGEVAAYKASKKKT